MLTEKIDPLAEAHDCLSQMRVREALKLFNAAESAGQTPDICAAGRWTCHMLIGNYEAAWRESDSIESRGGPDPHRFWDGQSLAGKDIILRCLHGLGDTIQFIRYVPIIRTQARTLTVEAQPKLKPLLEQARIADRVITWGDPEPVWNQQIEINELPRIFRTTLSTIPKTVPYLRLREEPAANCRLSRSLRVGIAWAASDFNHARSIPLELLAPLFDTSGALFFSVQGGSESAQSRFWAGRVQSLTDESTSILQVAHEMNGLDLIITVDTMTAHLAGALGRQTWTLLPFACDWRWMLGRKDSPWYPTMRLFRQTAPEDWLPVVQELAKELNYQIATRGLPAAREQQGE